MPDRSLHRMLVVALWLWWVACIVPWLCISWYEVHAHHDPGSWIGGGVVMTVLTVVVFGLLAVVRSWWRRSRG